jgi:hypothetical protein
MLELVRNVNKICSSSYAAHEHQTNRTGATTQQRPLGGIQEEHNFCAFSLGEAEAAKLPLK